MLHRCRTPALIPGLLLALAVLAGPACLYVGGRTSAGSRLDQGLEQRIAPGRTTKGEVLELLGPPREFQRPEWTAALVDDRVRVAGALSIANRAQDVFTYQFDKLEMKGTALILYNQINATVRSDLLVIFFDDQDVVVDVSLRQGGQVR